MLLLWFPEKSVFKDAPRVEQNFLTLVFRIKLKNVRLPWAYYGYRYRYNVKLERTTTNVVLLSKINSTIGTCETGTIVK